MGEQDAGSSTLLSPHRSARPPTQGCTGTLGSSSEHPLMGELGGERRYLLPEKADEICEGQGARGRSTLVSLCFWKMATQVTQATVNF